MNSWEIDKMTERQEELHQWRDPIVAEVRKAREALLESAGYDLDELRRRLRQAQKEAGRTPVTLPPRHPEESE